MKKRIAFPLICIAFIVGLFASYSLQETIGHAQQPDYAKWSKIAVNVMKENYPNYEVSDYKYEGRKEVNEEKAEDSFTFQIKKDNKESTIKVVVSFNPKTDTLKSLQIIEPTT